MKKRKRAVGGALLLLAFAAAVTFWFKSREPEPPSASTPAAPGPAPAPAPRLATGEEAAPVPTASPSAAGPTEAPVARETGSSSRVAPVVRSAKAARTLAEEPATGAGGEPAEPQEPAAEPVASAEPVPVEPTAKAPPPPPEAKPPQKPADGSALANFHNRVGPSFTLARVTCQIDGQTVYSGPGGANLELFQKNLAPGSHAVSVVAEYRGNTAGVFSYAQGFRFKVTSGRRFNVQSGKPVQLSITGYEKGGPTVDFGERLALTVSAR
jgi:hypothetical protein